MCHICTTDFRGSYTKVYCHLLGYTRQKLKVCKLIKEDVRVECHILHMEAQSRSKVLWMPTLSIVQMPSMVSSVSGSGDISAKKKQID